MTKEYELPKWVLEKYCDNKFWIWRMYEELYFEKADVPDEEDTKCMVEQMVAMYLGWTE